MENKKIIVLLGDIGGTNSRLSLVKINKDVILNYIESRRKR